MRTAVLITKPTGDKPAQAKALSVEEGKGEFKRLCQSAEANLEWLELWTSSAGCIKRKKFGGGTITADKSAPKFGDFKPSQEEAEKAKGYVAPKVEPATKAATTKASAPAPKASQTKTKKSEQKTGE